MTGSRVIAFVRALALFLAVAVAAPAGLVWAARARFGGPAPWSAMPAPGDWRWSTIRSALTDRLSEATIADIVIRVSLAVVWIAVVVVLVTVLAEIAHMVRHDGLPMPDVRGLATSQRLARVIAAGLLVVVPLAGQARTAVALDASASARPGPASTSQIDTARPENAWLDAGVGASDAPVTTLPTVRPAERVETVDTLWPVDTGSASPPAAPVAGGEYVVRAGDSVYGIAERIAGPDPRAVAAYADGLLELNLGHTMPDGQRFTNAAYIDVGWVLQLPAGGVAPIDAPSAATVHRVESGETLWSIADEHLGDGESWPEIFDANTGRRFDDGRVLDDPDLIRPGWDLVVPDAMADDRPADESGSATTDEPVADVTVADAAVMDAEASELELAAPGSSGETIDTVDTIDTIDTVDTVDDHTPDNVWITHGLPATPVAHGGPIDDAVGDVAAVPSGATAASDDELGGPSSNDAPDDASDDASDDGAELLTMHRAAMLSAGVLTLLAVRRRARLRRARPRDCLPDPAPSAVATERTLRQIDAGDRFARVDLAVRAAASRLVEHGAQVVAVVIAADGELELHTTDRAEFTSPWEPTADAHVWRLPASTPIELLAPDARRVGAPCPTLVQLGRDLAHRDVYVDLEALEAIEIGGSGAQADAVVAALAATLASSALAEVTTLIGVGVPDEAFLEHRLHRPVRDVQSAFETAAAAIGSTATAERSTFELRARGTGGETWEPAVVLAGAAAGTVSPPSRRRGLAVVSASPIHGPSSRLAPDGDAWLLRPLGLRIVPVGLPSDDLAAISGLTAVPEPVPADDPDVTIVGELPEDVVPDGDPVSDGAPSVRPHALVVRLLGPVSVESADGDPVDFERSKTRELVAWLATHRERATRSAARSALWELDVRDATFANVVSEARRALARCVEPPDGEEWVGRTMTDELPLHELVVTDVDLLDDALAAARLQPPAQSIETLRPAVERIVGLPFEGTTYLWPDAEGITSSIVMRAITATSELASHCLSVGDIDGVFAASGAGLRVLPAHEEMIAVRMRAYAQVGDRAGVRSEWETYERAITSDPWSDGEPSPRMLELRRELLAN